jgi:Tetratricopeptide repeat
VSRGRVSDAVPLLDEAMAAAISGELRPSTSRMVYCTTVGTCQQLADFRRAGEWTDATERCNARESIVPLGGDCRVHRAGILRVRGAWDEAEDEARSACKLVEGNDYDSGKAMYEIGEIRLRRGDLLAAEDWFQQAYGKGSPSQPGIALLRLAQGRPADAFSSISKAVARTPHLRIAPCGTTPGPAEPTRVCPLAAAPVLQTPTATASLTPWRPTLALIRRSRAPRHPRPTTKRRWTTGHLTSTMTSGRPCLTC